MNAELRVVREGYERWLLLHGECVTGGGRLGGSNVFGFLQCGLSNEYLLSLSLSLYLFFLNKSMV